jgi:hypothetical protein
MPGPTFTLAQESAPKHYSVEQREAVKHWAAWTAFLILGVMVIGAALVILIRRHRRLALRPVGERKRKKPKTRTDAWAESAKRLDPAEIGSPDDTVDIDPDELGPGDVDEGEGGGEDADPHGGRGRRPGR